MKGSFLSILTACLLAILVGFVSGYEAATYNVKVGYEVSSIKNEVQEIEIQSLELKDETKNDLTVLELNLTYNLPGKVVKENLQKYLSFKFSFSNKTKDILGDEATNKLKDYNLAALKKHYKEYNLNYILSLHALKKEELEYLKANYKNDIKIVIYIDNKVFKTIPLK